MNPSNEKTSLQKAVAISATLLGLFIVYRLLIFLLDAIAPSANDNNKEFIILLYGTLSPLVLLTLLKYLETGQIHLPSLRSIAQEPSDYSTQQYTYNFELHRGLSPFAALGLLVTIWVASSFYCQLLYAALYETLTPFLPKPSVEEIMTTLRGMFYLGTFFPGVAAGTLLCGCFARQSLSSRAALIPPLVMYGALNVLSIISTGYPSAFPVFLRKVVEQSHPVSSPAHDGQIVTIWIIAVLIFALVIKIMAMFIRFFFNIGHRLRSRLGSVSNSPTISDQ